LVERAYRIFERDAQGQMRTLFHGVDGSRLILPYKWHEATIKIVNDGGQDYWSGFHVFWNRTFGHEYLKRFDRDKRDLVVCPVDVKGELWHKPTNDDVILAQFMRIPKNARCTS
jgi:hypothetical protein